MLSIYLSPAHRVELIDCEMGSWEDCSKLVDGEYVVDPEEYGSDVHPVPLLQESRGPKDRLIVRTSEEADAIAYAVASGTFQLYHLRVARRVFDALRPMLSEDFLKSSWAGGPTGY